MGLRAWLLRRAGREPTRPLHQDPQAQEALARQAQAIQRLAELTGKRAELIQRQLDVNDVTNGPGGGRR